MKKSEAYVGQRVGCLLRDRDTVYTMGVITDIDPTDIMTVFSTNPEQLVTVQFDNHPTELTGHVKYLVSEEVLKSKLFKVLG